MITKNIGLILTENTIEKILTIESTQKIFINIESIQQLHNEIYIELEEKISDIRLVSSIEYSVSEIFAKNVGTQNFK